MKKNTHSPAKSKRSVSVLIPMMLCWLISTPVLSTNGVVEINHICATQLGCFSGDAIGYPITIDGTAGKSYRLTGDLIVPDDNTNGIDVDSINVFIDLNGFSIVRSGCENSAVDCTPSSGTGVGVGISVDDTAHFGLSVINGSIIGMGADGINNLAGSGHFDHLKLSWNRGRGINIGDNSMVSDSNASNNGGIGIYTGENSKVSDSNASNNGGIGINTRNNSKVFNSNASNNGGKELPLVMSQWQRITPCHSMAHMA